MKPFIGIDITEKKNNEEINGKEFVVQTTTPAMLDAYNKATDDMGDFCKKVKLPKLYQIAQKLVGVVAVGITAGFTRTVLNNDGLKAVAKIYENAAWAIWLGVACWIAFGLMTYFGRKKMKAAAESEEYNHIKIKTESLSNTIYSELGVPPQAPYVDVLNFQYKIKDGKLKPKGKDAKTVPFVNIIFKIHTDGQKLYLTDLESKYAFELSELKGIKVIKERGFIPSWNKDEPYDKGEYKQYKIVTNNIGLYFKNYCILELEHNGEPWSIYFPNYELPIFEKLTGLKAE